MAEPIHVIKPSFSGGEFAPSLYSRVDIQKYATGARRLRNFFVHPHGGISNRPGTYMVAAAKDNGKKVRVVPFEFASDENYVLEFGEYYIRFYYNNAQLQSGSTAIEVATPYTEADLAGLRFAQSADVLFIVHPDFSPRMLERTNSTTFVLDDYDFLNGPFQLPNDDTTHTMRVLATSGNTTLVSSAAFFYASHEGGLIQLTHQIEGQVLAQAFTSSTTSAAISCGGTWRIISHGTWTGKFKVEKSTDNGATWTCLRQFSGSNDFNVDTYGSEDMSDGALPFLVRVNMNAYTSGTCNVDLTTDPYATKGVAKMVTYISTTQMSVTMQRATGSTVVTSNWAEGAWSDYRGWPRAVTFAQDRLVFASNYNNPQTIWMTQTGDYYDFFVNSPVVDSDAISINLPSQQLNEINGLTSLLKLLVFSSGAEWTVGSEQSSILSPTTISTIMNSKTGSSGVQPVVIVNRAIYVQARGCVVRDLGYDIFTNTFTGANLSILANHLFFNQDIVEMAYQQDPDSIVWAIRNDGILLSMTYMREQEVLAWTWHDTYEGDDLFESVCSIPADGYDQVWFSVNRDGQRYVERMAQRLASTSREDQFFVDCGMTFDASTTPDAYNVLLMHFNADPFTDGYSHSITNAGLSSAVKLLLHCNGSNLGTTFTDEIGKTVTNTESYDSYTKLMLHLDNNVTDACSSPKTITNNNVTFSNAAGEYKWGYAGVFNGSTAYLTVPDSDDWYFGTGDFTIEFWVRFASSPDGLNVQFINQQNGASYWTVSYQGDYKLHIQCYDGGVAKGSYETTSGFQFTVGQWYHLAFERVGTSAKIFKDGVSLGLTEVVAFSTNDVGNISGLLNIGSAVGGGNYVNGWMDEIRISKGIARWTADFNPSYSPYGRVYTLAASPKFGSACAYFPVGSYLSLADSADWYFGTGDFTLDTWVKFNNIEDSDTPQLFGQFDDATHYTHWNITRNGSTYYMDFANGDLSINFRRTLTECYLGTWYHFAIIRTGNTFRGFQNGAQIGTDYTSSAAVQDLAAAATIGYFATPTVDYLDGWIDEFRIVKGAAKWTADFTPPIYAYSSAIADTTQYKFSPSSIYFNGQDNYIYTPDSADWYFGTGDFTIDFWIRFKSLTGDMGLISQKEDATNYWWIYKNATTHKLTMIFADGGVAKGNYTMTNNWSLNINTWYHLTFVRTATTAKIFIDGVSQVLTEDTAFGTNDVGNMAGALNVGEFNDANFFNGWIDELRISKGVARWTGNFVPPTSPYTIYGGDLTTLTGLDHLEGRTVSILADGTVVTPQEVVSGEVTLPSPTTLAHVGLGYNCDLETLNIELGLPDGTLQGRKVQIGKVVMRLDNSRGGYSGPDFDHLYEIQGDYKTSVDTSLYTGDIKLLLGGGYKEGGRFCFRQSDPLPVTILGVLPLVTAGYTTGL